MSYLPLSIASPAVDEFYSLLFHVVCEFCFNTPPKNATLIDAYTEKFVLVLAFFYVFMYQRGVKDASFSRVHIVYESICFC